MKRSPLHILFVLVFIFTMSMLSVNYLWSMDNQLVEEETHAQKTPSGKNTGVSMDEYFFGKCEVHSFTIQALVETAKEFSFAHHSNKFAAVHLDVETPPPDRA